MLWRMEIEGAMAITGMAELQQKSGEGVIGLISLSCWSVSVLWPNSPMILRH